MIVGFTGLLVKCVMETVERWCGAVGKVRNAKISVCRRLFVRSKQLCACVRVCVFTAPKVSDVTVTSCVVDWTPLKPLGADSLVYVLQLQRISSRDADYHEVCSAH